MAMSFEQILQLGNDLMAVLKDVETAATAKQLPTLDPFEKLLTDLMAQAQKTAAAVKAPPPNPPKASPPA
jgi:hypothetical protein